MPAAVRISMCGFHDDGMTVLDERQKLQQRESKNGNGAKVAPPPPPSKMGALENLARE